MSESEQFAAWRDGFPQTMDGYPTYTIFDAWQASRRAALEEAAKWFEASELELTRQDCATAIRALTDGDKQ